MAAVAKEFTRRGKKIIGIGRNYLDHVKELKNEAPSSPFFFLKPTTSYAFNGQNIEIPRGILCHHEVELGVVIGSKCRSIKAEDAMKAVAGYTLAIDLTARNLQEEVKKKQLPWSAVKGFDTFCPVGKFIPSSTVLNPHALMLWLKINGVFKQKASTGNMIFNIPQLIEHCSGIMTLEEGDLLLTGTPAGVGPVKPGDLVEAGLEQSDILLDELRHTAIQRNDGFSYPNSIISSCTR
ncbi:hypothetical protein CROQUDRAFT_672992 [Cronartium quercuum f. sp. fusiforme G11]|uniref:Fumarylacetoacetase-like C-terminal domain-containing protein n=1 Tax=Cronartium quercuum f. sp. fusiforme G11 TaxID=708437 RepID=A0A9P6NFU0_9BASI|nr:hypothetical protein CROQUDRAFT_672992 [Cronartium quercuum f. sp. fusiforme G11]